MIDEKIELIIDEEFLEKAKKDNFHQNSHYRRDIQTNIPCKIKIGEKVFEAEYTILCIKDIYGYIFKELNSIKIIRQLSKIEVKIHNPEENFMLFYNLQKKPKSSCIELLGTKYYIGDIQEYNFKYTACFVEY